MVVAEGFAKLCPTDVVVDGMHGDIIGPQCSGSTPKLMGNKQSPLVVLAPEKYQLLLNGTELVIGVEGILSTREARRLSLKEVREVIMAFGSTSSMRVRVAHESFEKSGLSLVVLFNLHQHFRHARRWRRY